MGGPLGRATWSRHMAGPYGWATWALDIFGQLTNSHFSGAEKVSFGFRFSMHTIFPTPTVSPRRLDLIWIWERAEIGKCSWDSILQSRN